MKLKDKNIIVTGGYRGLGLAVTKAYLKEGAKVAICGRQLESLKKLDEELSNYKEQFFYCQCDISDPLEVANFIKKVIFEFKSIDVLVNNASIYGCKHSFLDTEPSLFKEALNINILGSFNVLQAVLKNMLEQEYGKIICISSTAIEDNEKAGTAYHITKSSQVAMAMLIARQYFIKNIATNIVNPYGISQDIESPFFDPKNLNNNLSADHIADLFIYLASPEANGINGKIFKAIEWSKN